MDQNQDAEAGGFICATCGMSLETQEDLDRHVAAEHGEADEEQTARG